MCRGLAAGWDVEQSKMICTGKSSHTKTLGNREDHCVKLEITITDSETNGYKIELDDGLTSQPECAKPYITKANGMTERLAEITEDWRKKNHTKILRWLLFCRSYAELGDSYAYSCKIKGDSYAYSCEIKGDSNAYGCEIKGDSNASDCKIEGNSYAYSCKIKGDSYAYSCKIEGDSRASDCKIKGDSRASDCKIKGDSYAYSCKIKGDSRASNCKIKGDSYTSGCEIGREWYIGRTTLTKYPNTTEILKSAKDDWRLTLPQLVRWVAEHSEEVMKKMGDEGK